MISQQNMNSEHGTRQKTRKGLSPNSHLDSSQPDHSLLFQGAATPLPLKPKNKDSHINVAVRVRPILQHELDRTQPEVSVIDTTKDLVVVALTKSFRFDKIFDSDSTQEHVYSSFIEPLVDQVKLLGLIMICVKQLK